MSTGRTNALSRRDDQGGEERRREIVDEDARDEVSQDEDDQRLEHQVQDQVPGRVPQPVTGQPEAAAQRGPDGHRRTRPRAAGDGGGPMRGGRPVVATSMLISERAARVARRPGAGRGGSDHGEHGSRTTTPIGTRPRPVHAAWLGAGAPSTRVRARADTGSWTARHDHSALRRTAGPNAWSHERSGGAGTVGRPAPPGQRVRAPGGPGRSRSRRPWSRCSGPRSRAASRPPCRCRRAAPATARRTSRRPRGRRPGRPVAFHGPYSVPS